MTEMCLQVGLGSERYAIPVASVLEVAEPCNVAVVPGAPSALLGICNLRGTILPVFDLATILGVPRGEDGGVIVVTRYEHASVGLAVSTVIGVDELPPPSEPTQSPHLKGAVLHEQALIGVIAADSIIETVVGEPARA